MRQSPRRKAGDPKDAAKAAAPATARPQVEPRLLTAGRPDRSLPLDCSRPTLAVFAFTLANLAGRLLAEACGSEAQAVALVDSWITALVRQRARAAALRLDLGLVPGFAVLSGFGFDLGFPPDPGGVLAAGLPLGFLRRDALGGLIGLC